MKLKLIIPLILVLTGCSMFQQECLNGYYYDFLCHFPDYNTYHDGNVTDEEFYVARQAIEEVQKERCFHNGATEIEVTCYRIICGNLSTEPLYKEKIKK